MLLNQSADRVELSKETTMIEVCKEKTFENIKSPRVLNSHILFRMLPKDLLKMKSKIIFIHRSLKDSCVSFYDHQKKRLNHEYDGKFENYIHRFLNGQCKYLHRIYITCVVMDVFWKLKYKCSLHIHCKIKKCELIFKIRYLHY